MTQDASSSPKSSSSDEQPQLFLRAASGDTAAMDEAMTVVYAELRHIAHAEARRARRGAFQPTAVVHETYLRLRGQRSGGWSDRSSFLAIAARVMRRVLVDRARTAGRMKRGEGQAEVDAYEATIAVDDESMDVLAVHDLLEEFAKEAPDEAEVAELIVFGGLTIPEAAEVVAVSARTVDRRWRFARAWLSTRVQNSGEESA